MNIKPSMSKRAIRITTALALVAVMSLIAASLLMTGTGGATAFNFGASDSAARHMPIPAQYTTQCSNGTAVPNPADNAGLVADCAALLASKDTLEGTTGGLNWSADRPISWWYGISTANNRVSRLELALENLNGEIPAELGNLANLEYLIIYRNQLTGEIPAELGNLANLQYLDILSTELTGDIPAELGNLANLVLLNLTDTELTGAIPPELGNLAKLTSLRLSGNQLTGAIPAELGNLANLTLLNLTNNQLTGAIPPELGNLASLTVLSLSRNQLTGEIPAKLGDLSNLNGLYLNGNQLMGDIPPELGNLANLTELYLGGNQLTGCLPPSLLHALRGHLGLPVCSDTTAATPTPTATSVASNDVINRLITDMADLKEQVSSLATRVAAIEGASAIAPPTPTHTPTATPIIITGATPLPTPTSVAGATPSPTATRVAGTSGGNACVTRLAGGASVSGSWSDACLSANSPPNDETYYSRFYTFTLDAAARVTITLSSATAAPYLYLLDGAGTDGAVRLSNGDVATSVAITANLPPGAYTIEASTWYSETYGDFTLELEIR